MTKLLTLAILLLVPCAAKAAPYFATPLSLSAVEFEAGVGLDPSGKSAPQALTVGALAWHNPVTPTLLDPAWSPLSIGGAGTTWDTVHLVIGPSVNLAPQAIMLVSQALDFLAPGQFANLQSALKQGGASPTDAGLCVAPMLEVIPSQKWSGRFLPFIGGWLKFSTTTAK